MRALTLILAAFLAGCAGAPEVSDPATSRGPSSAPFNLGRCDILEGILEVDAALAAPHVPPGFALAASDGRTSAVLGAARCENGSRAFLALPVDPEDDRLAAPGVRHFFEPEHFVDEGALVEALDRIVGNATRASIEATAAPLRPAFTVGGEGWTHRVEGAGAALAPAPDALVGGVFREWFAAEGGYAYLEAAFASEGASLLATAAEASTGEGTVARELMGASALVQLIVLDESGYAGAAFGFTPFP